MTRGFARSFARAASAHKAITASRSSGRPQQKNAGRANDLRVVSRSPEGRPSRRVESSARPRRKNAERVSGRSAANRSREGRPKRPPRGLRRRSPRRPRWPNSRTRSARPGFRCPAVNGAAHMIRRAARRSSSAGKTRRRSNRFDSSARKKRVHPTIAPCRIYQTFGGLSVAELDQLRAKRRPSAKVAQPESIGADPTGP
jgi:hypothetical protein